MIVSEKDLFMCICAAGNDKRISLSKVLDYEIPTFKMNTLVEYKG